MRSASGAPPKEGGNTFESFLRDYEPKLNEQVRKILGKRAFDAETFMDYKLACAAVMLERWRRFDSAKGIQFATFAHHDVKNSLLRARMLEEAGSFASLDEYKEVRRMGRAHVWRYAARGDPRVRKKARLLGGGRKKVFENCPAHSGCGLTG